MPQEDGLAHFPSDTSRTKLALVLFRLSRRWRLSPPKPENVLAKIVDGRLSKFYRENALVEQDHMVQEGNPKVMDAMQELGKSAGVGSISVPAFFRAAVGETASQEE